MFEQLKDVPVVDLILYLSIMGAGMGFMNRVPAWAFEWFKKAWKAIRKAEYEELVGEAPHGCKSELECQQRITSAVSHGIQDAFLPVVHQIEEVDRKVGELNTEVQDGLKELDTKMGTKLDRVHSRIDSHLNEEAKAAAGKVA